MTKPIINSFSSLAPLIIQKYERYLPTAFDESMTLLQKVNKIIKYLDDTGTLMSDLLTQWNSVMEWVADEGVSDSVTSTLDKWSTDGTLSNLINNVVFSGITNSINLKADKTYVDGLTKSLVNGSPKGVYATLTDLQTAKPTGDNNIYVVSADGNWYYYDTTWKSGGMYQGVTLGDLSIKSEQIKKGNVLPLDLYVSDTINLFDVSKASSDTFIGNDGIVATLTGYSYSDLIPVVAGETYVISQSLSSQGGFYTNNRDWLDKIPQALSAPLGGFLVTIPSNPSGIAYMRVNTSNASTFMLVKGNKLPSSYYGYGDKRKIGWLKPDIDVLPSTIVTMENLFGGVSGNLFDKTTLTTGKYLDNTGALLDTTIINLGDYIPVIPLASYSVPKGYSTQGGMYDRNKNYIGAIPHPAASTGTTWTFTLPTNCYFVRLNVLNGDINTFMLVSGTSYPSSYSSYGITIPWLKLSSAGAVSKWASKKWGVIGDSITEHNFRTTKNYHDYIADTIGCSVTNYGVSGTGWRTPSSGGAQAIYQRIPSMSSDLDLITVFAGTNDWGQTGTPLVLGSFGDTTTSTLYGTIDNVIKQLVSKYLGKTIAVFTPLQRANGFVANSVGVTMEQIADAIIKVCNYYGVPVLDLYRNNNLSVWDSASNTYYFTPSGTSIPTGSEAADGLHPNDNGHKVLADKILSFLNRL